MLISISKIKYDYERLAEELQRIQENYLIPQEFFKQFAKYNPGPLIVTTDYVLVISHLLFLARLRTGSKEVPIEFSIRPKLEYL